MDLTAVDLISMLGVVGTVILLTALLSGLMDRIRLPHIFCFLALGVVLGPVGLDVVDIGLDSPSLRIIATLGLLLVLFTDAVSVTLAELRRRARLAAIILGPGTLLTAAVIGLSAHFLLGLGAAESAILGAALASTDPVLLRGLLRSPATPEPARNALRIESGMNDAVLLPVVLIAMSFLPGPTGGMSEAGWVEVALDVLLIGGGAGAVVGLLGVGALDFVRRSVGVRRDYESLYVLGLALTAFAVAEAFHGSGFIAAFTAGITIAALDVEMCDCFYDYGEATAEMALLFTFVVLGSAAIWQGLDVVEGSTLAFAAVALFVRGVILFPALKASRLDARSRRFTVWFGPRGLSSLLLVLLPVFAGAPGAERLFEVTALVVLLSVAFHGGSQVLLREPRAAEGAAAPRPEPAVAATGIGAGAAAAAREGVEGRPAAAGAAEGTAPPEGRGESEVVSPGAERITLEEVQALERRGEPVVFLDVRKDTAYEAGETRARGARRLPPEGAVRTVGALNLPHDAWLVSYCT